MQTRGGLVEDVHRATGGPLLQFGGELDALRFTTGQSRSRLTQSDIAQADVDQRLEVPVN